MKNLLRAHVRISCFLLIALMCKGALSAESIATTAPDSERRIEALRNALINRALQAPTQIQSAAWIDESGRLQENTRITSDMKVRGIRIEPSPDAQDVTQEKIIIDAANSIISPAQCGAPTTQWTRSAILKIEQQRPNGVINQDHIAEIARITGDIFSEKWAEKGLWTLLPSSDLNLYEQMVRVGTQVSAPYKITISIGTSKIEPTQETISQSLLKLFSTNDSALPKTTLTLTVHLSEASSNKIIWSTSSPLHYPSAEVSIQKRPLPASISTQLHALIATWQQQVSIRLKCEPVFFNVSKNVDGSVTVNAGSGSGLRENDKVLVFDQTQVPRHILEGGLDKSVFLAEIESVSKNFAKLRFFSPPPSANASRWIAIPL